MIRVVALVQARLGSTRLPGKVLCDIAGSPMLARVVARARRARRIEEVVVATSIESGDDRLFAYCQAHGISCFRGSEHDVLDRYFQGAREARAQVVVRLTADCPLLDSSLVDRVVTALVEGPSSTGSQTGSADYASNVFPRRTYPRGLDVEALRFSLLERLWREARDPASREHVTAYVHRHPERFRIATVAGERDLSWLRWTVDEAADLELVRRIYGCFPGDDFGWEEALDALERHPGWLELNRSVVQKSVC